MNAAFCANIIKMVPAMEGDRPKCYREKTLLTEAALDRGQQCFRGVIFRSIARHESAPFLYRTEQSFWLPAIQIRECTAQYMLCSNCMRDVHKSKWPDLVFFSPLHSQDTKIIQNSYSPVGFFLKSFLIYTFPCDESTICWRMPSLESCKKSPDKML
jgi:hypothetical protein